MLFQFPAYSHASPCRPDPHPGKLQVYIQNVFELSQGEYEARIQCGIGGPGRAEDESIHTQANDFKHRKIYILKGCLTGTMI